MRHTLELVNKKITFEASEHDAEIIKRTAEDLYTRATYINLCSVALREALSSIKNAKGLLIDINSSSDITLPEMSDSISAIQNDYGSDVHVVRGHVIDECMGGTVNVSLVAAN